MPIYKLKQSALAETRKKGWRLGDQLMVYGSWHSLASFFIQRHRGCQHIDACQIEVSRQWPRGGIFVLESWSPASIERRQQSKCSYLKMININVDLAVKDAMFSLWCRDHCISGQKLSGQNFKIWNAKRYQKMIGIALVELKEVHWFWKFQGCL